MSEVLSEVEFCQTLNNICDEFLVDSPEYEKLKASHRALAAELAQVKRECKALEHHHDATRHALGLSGAESRPHAAYVRDLKAQLQQVTAERDRLKDDPDYRQCCDLRVKAEQERDYANALLVLAYDMKRDRLDDIEFWVKVLSLIAPLAPLTEADLAAARAVVERGKP